MDDTPHCDKPRSVWTSHADRKSTKNSSDENDSLKTSLVNYENPFRQKNLSEKGDNVNGVKADIVNVPDKRPVNVSVQAKPENSFGEENEFKRKIRRRLYTCTYSYRPPRYYNLFWYLVSLTSVVTIDINIHYGGVELDLSAFDGLVMLICAFLLNRCFQKGNVVVYGLPWLIIYFWSLYSCQYLSLVQIVRTYSYTEAEVTPILFITYAILVLNLGLRFVVWCKVLDFLVGTDLSERIFYWLDLLVYMSNKIAWVRNNKTLTFLSKSIN